MNRGRRALLRLAPLLALPPVAIGATGDGTEVHAIIGRDNDRQQAIVQALRRAFPGLTTSPDGSRAATSRRPLAYVAIGPGALQAALTRRLDAPVISTLTSRQGVARAIAQGVAGNRVTALYAEPSPDAQMRLIAALFHRRVTVGALVSDGTEFMLPLLRQAARDHALDLMPVHADAGVSLSRNLLRLASATVLLIFPDSDLYTPTTLRELLETTYRRRQPVVGFSQGLVGAGTLASAYSDTDDTVAQLQATVGAIGEGRLPEPQYPRYWHVAINDSVARSLDVVVDDAVRQLGDRP